MPILTALKEKNLLRHTTFDIVGGECTEYENGKLEDIVKFAMDGDYWLHFFSSGIFYSEVIADAMKKSRANIVVSVDSGTKETYEKIKRVKTFDKVWENMAKYSRAGVQDDFCNKGYVILKYIIIPKVNDSLEEFIVPGCTWAIFAGQGTNKSIQELEKRIVTEWLPTSGYEYADGPDIEVYFNADPENAKYEVWIPVTKKED